jgi:hypothetical protein
MEIRRGLVNLRPYGPMRIALAAKRTFVRGRFLGFSSAAAHTRTRKYHTNRDV